MRTAPFLCILTALVATLPGHAAQDFSKDVPGSKDPAPLQRIDGSVILRQTSKKFAALTIPLERILFDYKEGKPKPFAKTAAEGALTTTFYRLPQDASTLEAIRAYQGELEAAGFEVVFEGTSGGKPSGDSNTLDDGYGRFIERVYESETDYGVQKYVLAGSDDFRYIALKKPASGDEGDIYVTVFAGAVTDSWKDPEKGLLTGTIVARVDVLHEKPRANRMVTVKAEEMEKQIDSAGRIALYGILFDFNKSTLKPESDPTLVEIVSLLKEDPALKLLVVGHTDNVGDFEFNRDLSARRANAVVESLVSKHGIEKGRLFPFGCSFASPAAPNTTEDGKAKNRRVELVRWN